MDRSAVQLLSASNRVRAANLGEPSSDNELVAFHLLPNAEVHQPFSRGSQKRHAILFLAMNGPSLTPLPRGMKPTELPV